MFVLQGIALHEKKCTLVEIGNTENYRFDIFIQVGINIKFYIHFHLIRFTSTAAVNYSDLFKNTEVAEDVFHIEEKYFDSWNEVRFRGTYCDIDLIYLSIRSYLKHCK